MKSEQPSGFLQDPPLDSEPEQVDFPDQPSAEVNGGIGTGPDPLDALVQQGADFPMSLIAGRIREIERHVPDAIKVGQGMGNLAGRVTEIEKAVHYLSQQRAVAEVQMERQVRAVALDLAIKALPDSAKASLEAADVMTATADAFLAWLKAGTQA